MAQIRRLTQADQPRVEAFLAPYVETSMFLLSNLRAAGLEFNGQTYQGIWLGVWQDGELQGVLTHFWNGLLMSQSPLQWLPALLDALPRHSQLHVAGYTGDVSQGKTLIRLLGLQKVEFQMYSPEVHYSLSLDKLQCPALLQHPEISVRKLQPGDDFMLPWRVAYSCEALDEPDTAALRERMAQRVAKETDEGTAWVLFDSGKPVSTSAFNAQLPQCVQIGGVWTPSEYRGRGYARAIVAATLLEAREREVERAILFTDKPNTPARRAYESLGFEAIGEYGLFFLREPVALKVKANIIPDGASGASDPRPAHASNRHWDRGNGRCSSSPAVD